MKIELPSAELRSALDLLRNIISTHPAKPNLSCVRIQAGTKGCLLEGTDMKTAIRVRIGGAESAKEGSWLVPAEILRSVVQAHREESIGLSFERACKVEGEAGQFEVPIVAEEDYPGYPGIEETASFETPSERFVAALRGTSFAASRERARYAFNGVRIEQSKKDCRCVATDGRRLAWSAWSAEKGSGEMAAVVPAESVSILEKWLSGVDGTARVATDGRWLSVEAGEASLVTRFLEGSFPDYREVIPKEGPARWTVEKGVLEDSLRRASIAASPAARSVDLRLSPEGSEMSAESPENGKARVPVAGTYKGPAVAVRINPDFVLDFVRAAEASPVTVSLRDATAALLFSAGAVQYVLMPLRQA